MELAYKAKEIRILLLQGKINYEEAKEMLKPIVNEANKKAEKIAKQFDRKHHNFNVTTLLR